MSAVIHRDTSPRSSQGLIPLAAIAAPICCRLVHGLFGNDRASSSAIGTPRAPAQSSSAVFNKSASLTAHQIFVAAWQSTHYFIYGGGAPKAAAARIIVGLQMPGCHIEEKWGRWEGATSVEAMPATINWNTYQTHLLKSFWPHNLFPFQFDVKSIWSSLRASPVAKRAVVLQRTSRGSAYRWHGDQLNRKFLSIGIALVNAVLDAIGQ